jgi:putative oxidoreductase
MKSVTNFSLTSQHSRALRIAIVVARVLLGFILIAAVLLRVFVPERGPSFPVEAKRLLEVMQGSYLTPLVYLTEFLVGLCLVAGRFVPLALLVFAPVHLNIMLFHLLLDLQPLRIAQIMITLGCHLFLVWTHWAAFSPTVTMRSPVKLPRGLTILRILLALMLLGSGIGKLAVPFSNLEYGHGQFFMTVLHDSGFLFTLLAFSEIAIGLLLLFNFFTPLALVLLAPIAINILAFHIFVNPSVNGFAATLFLLISGALLAWRYRDHYQAVLRS